MKSLGGKSGLGTVKLVVKLANYDGYAIRNNSHFIECMKNSVWVTFYEKVSQGQDPWCQ